MSELLTAAQMRAIEQAAIESGEVTGLELMERAGQGVVEAIFAEWPELAKAPHRAVVLCGPGNNGGDGFVVARLLHGHGWAVEAFLYGDADKLPQDARANYERWCALGEVAPYIDEGENAFWMVPKSYTDQSVLIDALFGTGLVRPVETLNAVGWATQITEWRLSKANRKQHFPGIRVVAVDIPSGVCSDSGRSLQTLSPPRDWEEIQADLTVTFHSQKLGHVLAEGAGRSNKVAVVDIGLSCLEMGGRNSCKTSMKLTGEKRLGRVITSLVESPSGFLEKWTNEHKFSHGHALLLSGGSGKTGAARLAARGALRIGAGLVTLGVPPSAQQEVACHITALMLQRVGDAEAFEAVLEDARITALCLGPGLGVARAQALVPVALASARPTVLDADALTAFADDPDLLFSQLHETCVLTPHGGEFARLFPDIAEKLKATPTVGPAYSKVDATRAAAARAGCVVLFKGADTVIAAPDGQCSVHGAVYERAAPWLATAGAGDVLAGFITGLLARGFAPMQAAETAAWLHVECARSFGPGLIAEDLPEVLPEVLSRLQNTPS